MSTTTASVPGPSLLLQPKKLRLCQPGSDLRQAIVARRTEQLVHSRESAIPPTSCVECETDLSLAAACSQTRPGDKMASQPSALPPPYANTEIFNPFLARIESQSQIYTTSNVQYNSSQLYTTSNVQYNSSQIYTTANVQYNSSQIYTTANDSSNSSFAQKVQPNNPFLTAPQREVQSFPDRAAVYSRQSSLPPANESISLFSAGSRPGTGTGSRPGTGTGSTPGTGPGGSGPDGCIATAQNNLSNVFSSLVKGGITAPPAASCTPTPPSEHNHFMTPKRNPFVSALTGGQGWPAAMARGSPPEASQSGNTAHLHSQGLPTTSTPSHPPSLPPQTQPLTAASSQCHSSLFCRQTPSPLETWPTPPPLQFTFNLNRITS